MKYYNLINPSDNYSLMADDDRVAILAATLVGNGAYALEDEERKDVLPIFLFGGLDEWFRDKFGEEIAACLERNMLVVADCLDSFAICSIRDRAMYDEALAAMIEPARSEWKAKWHDKNRSSMNNIGGRASHYATALRVKAEQKKVQP